MQHLVCPHNFNNINIRIKLSPPSSVYLASKCIWTKLEPCLCFFIMFVQEFPIKINYFWAYLFGQQQHSSIWLIVDRIFIKFNRKKYHNRIIHLLVSKENRKLDAMNSTRMFTMNILTIKYIIKNRVSMTF